MASNKHTNQTSHTDDSSTSRSIIETADGQIVYVEGDSFITVKFNGGKNHGVFKGNDKEWQELKKKKPEAILKQIKRKETNI